MLNLIEKALIVLFVLFLAVFYAFAIAMVYIHGVAALLLILPAFLAITACALELNADIKVDLFI